MATTFLTIGPEAATTVLLAHGAGAPMDSAAMSASAQALAEAGLRVVRFEFDYMAARRTSDTRRPPPRAETLVPEYLAAIDALGSRAPLIIGGKSMGGRVASMIADELYASGRIAGLLCLGYPFHPIGKPGQLRTAHLQGMKTPTLIVQGTRDLFGTREEVATYVLSKSIEILWIEDGDHDLRSRKSVTGLSPAENLRIVGAQVASWCARIAR
ncbi:alpha/beta fold hydrolase [Starkeya sp. ORNL1]|uniref:alpha/beta hydrolase family protein n=1 Tax=Starkeya sp. ORNL1 TaxID=2709380 RepID=UPI001462F30F|nr:alpha/beta family hydrolase [Starkeya sp. ORNL1]QJP14583.1 alpha/beta fold hydrolase [Starkeya sp. ORNL1]